MSRCATARGTLGWARARATPGTAKEAVVKAIRRFTVRSVLPESLDALGELAGNLRWSWHEPTRQLFESVSPELWEATGKDPVTLLGAVDPELLERLAADEDFVARANA